MISTHMTSKINLGSIILAVIIAVVLVGGGVYFWQQNNIQPDTNVALQPDVVETKKPPITETPPVKTTDEEVSVIVEPITPIEPRVLAPAQTDASWETYTSPSFGFTVMTPLKGKYAPTWEMKNFSLDDSLVRNGCYYKSDNTTEDARFGITQGQVTFCQTSTEDIGAGQRDIVDDYATIIGTKVVVIEFTKRTVNAGMMDCADKMTEPYSTSGTYCIPFIESEYQATLDGIVGTFTMNE